MSSQPQSPYAEQQELQVPMEKLELQVLQDLTEKQLPIHQQFPVPLVQLEPLAQRAQLD